MSATILAGLGLAALAAAPAQASAGESKRGCTPYWVDDSTDGWDHCYNATVQVKLHGSCLAEPDYNGPWVTINGSREYVDSYVCYYETNNAWISVK